MLSSIRWAFNFKEWRPTADEWKLAVQCVQKEEKEKIYRFVYSKDAKASMIGRLLMRKAANEAVGIPYNEIKFCRTEHGKPYLCNAEKYTDLKFSFNVSHHGDVCAIAAEKNYNVGVDIMKVEYTGHKPLAEYFNLMKKQFSHAEREYMMTPALESVQLKRFYRIWCLKESFVKCEGTGISCDLQSISFTCPTASLNESKVTTDSTVCLKGNVQTNWRFEESLLNSDHCVAVALEDQFETANGFGSQKSAKFSWLTYAELMENSVPFEDSDDTDYTKFLEKEEKLWSFLK